MSMIFALLLDSFFVRYVFVIFLIIAVFAVFFSEIISKSISKPVSEILSIVRKISNDNFEGQVKIDSKDEFGEIALSINEMIDKLKMGRLNLQKEKDKLSKTIENIPQGILLVDRKLNVLIHNRFFVEKIDLSGGLPLFIHKLIKRVIKNGEYAFEDVTTKYPEKKRLKISAAPVLEAKTGINEVIVVVEDVTELYALENIRRDFVSNASHELKTPVSSLMLITENLKYAIKSDPARVDQFVDILEKEATRLSRLVNDLLDLSRLEKPLSSIEKIKVQALIDETLVDVKGAIENKKIEMVISADEGLEIFGDKKQIQIALMNLLENALSYTPENGTIRLIAAEDNNLLEISVEDTGCGIHSRHLNRIFERFYRADKARSRQSGGTGLGLSIVKNTMELHGGSVRVESQVGVGSKFTLVFPLPV